MVDNSNAREGSALDEELFIDKIEALSTLARGSDYLMEHLGTYISQICEAAAQHHVLMNQSFVSAALAIKVQEGIVLCKFVIPCSLHGCLYGNGSAPDASGIVACRF